MTSTTDAIQKPTLENSASSSVSVLLYGLLNDPASAELASISAIGPVKMTMVPCVTIFDDVLCTIWSINNGNQNFKMIHPDFLPGKLEKLKEKHLDLIVVNISNPDAALRLAELCCPLTIPFITLALFSETHRLKGLIEASSTPAVVLPTEAVVRTSHKEQEDILTDGIRATILLAEKIAEGTSGCFLREDLPA